MLLFAMLESEHHAAVATQVRHEPSDPEQGQSVIESDHHELDVDESLAVHSPTADPCVHSIVCSMCNFVVTTHADDVRPQYLS